MPPVARRITRKPSAPAHGITQSNRCSGSAIGAGGEICLQRQLVAQQGQRIALCPLPLRHAQLAEVLARCASAAHGVVGQQCEALVRAAGAVRPDAVAREAAELSHQIVEGVASIGVAGDARHHLGIAALHCPRGATQCHDAAGAAGRQEFQEARRQPDILHEGRGTVRCQREAGQAQAIDLLLRKSARLQQFAQRAAQPPRGRFLRSAHVRHGDRRTDDDVAVVHHAGAFGASGGACRCSLVCREARAPRSSVRRAGSCWSPSAAAHRRTRHSPAP